MFFAIIGIEALEDDPFAFGEASEFGSEEIGALLAGEHAAEELGEEREDEAEMVDFCGGREGAVGRFSTGGQGVQGTDAETSAPHISGVVAYNCSCG